MKRFLKTRKKSELGASLVEYGLLVALIAVISVAAVQTAGKETRLTFQKAEEVLGKNVVQDEYEDE